MAVDQDNGQVDPSIPESYEHLLEDYSQFAPPAADEVVQGTVLGITAKDVIVDFGYKSEGIVPIEQFQSPTGEVTVKRGDVVDVMIDRSEQVEGYVLLSHTKAARLRIWDDLEKASNDQLILSGRVLGRVKGGLAVDVGRQSVHARFAGRPASGTQSGFPDRAGHPGQDHQAQPAPRQCGGLAQSWRSRKRSIRARRSPWSTCPRARPSWARSRT